MKDIKGYEGLYAVTKDGQVWSYRKERFLIPQKDHDGYLKVGLSRKGKQKLYFMHRLVAETYLPNVNNFSDVNHIDENKANNNVTNLEWTSHAYNVTYSVGKPIYCVELDKVFSSLSEGAKATNIKVACINACVKGRQKTAGKLHWRYMA